MQVIKDAMDKKFGPPWHIVAGKFFSYEVTYEVCASWGTCYALVYVYTSPLTWGLCAQCKHLLYLYVGGTTGEGCRACGFA